MVLTTPAGFWGHMGWHARSFKMGIPRCLAIAFAAIAILLTPVEYRAGADLPHPHAMLQLIYEASRGIPLHHHAVSFDSQNQTAPQGTGATTHTIAGHRTGGMQAAMTTPGPDVAQQADVSLAVVVKMFVALVPVFVALPSAFFSIHSQLRDTLALRGVSLTPETPPPRG